MPQPVATADRTEIWVIEFAHCGEALDALEAATARLSPSESRDLAVPTQRHRRLTRIALRLLLERALEGPARTAFRRRDFALTPAGRPSFSGVSGPCGGPDFNVSQTATHALIGISYSGSQIGVDIEAERELAMAPWRITRLIEAAQRLPGSSPAGHTSGTPPADRIERPHVQSQPHAALRAWTRLEALAKARGDGIAELLGAIGVMGTGRESRTASDVDDLAAGWQVVDLDLANAPVIGAGCLVAACALAADAPPPLIRSLPATLTALDDLAA